MMDSELATGQKKSGRSNTKKGSRRGLSIPRNFTIFDDYDQMSLVREVMEGLELDQKQYHPREMLNFISRAKEKLIRPEVRRFAGPIESIAEKTLFAIRGPQPTARSISMISSCGRSHVRECPGALDTTRTGSSRPRGRVSGHQFAQYRPGCSRRSIAT
jgi:hypothetical protein